MGRNQFSSQEIWGKGGVGGWGGGVWAGAQSSPSWEQGTPGTPRPAPSAAGSWGAPHCPGFLEGSRRGWKEEKGEWAAEPRVPRFTHASGAGLQEQGGCSPLFLAFLALFKWRIYRGRRLLWVPSSPCSCKKHSDSAFDGRCCIPERSPTSQHL